MKRIKLLFDKRVHAYGSKEHYWHFMLGYLLPAVHYYYKAGDQALSLCYEDCGPLMNPLIVELNQLLDIPFEIIESDLSQEASTFDDAVYLPRWDVRMYISFYFLRYPNRSNSDIPIKRKDVKWFVNKNISFRRKSKGFQLRKDILTIRKRILDKIEIYDQNKEAPYLLLDRSDIHQYYSSDGQAKVKGYGKSRRGLLNLREQCTLLNQQKIKTIVYEPGAHSLVDQIKAFNKARGVIAIRGAELANMIWMKPKSKVIVIGFDEPAFHLYNYTSLLNLRLTERQSKTDFPDIRTYPIKTLIAND